MLCRDLVHLVNAETVRLDDLETVMASEVVGVFQHAYRALRGGGMIELSFLDWAWCIQYSKDIRGTDQKLADALYDRPRKMVFDELFIIRMLFQAGFYKIWSGHVPELPEWLLYAKAVKLLSSR